MVRSFAGFILLNCFSILCSAQKPDTLFLEKLLRSKPDLFLKILNHPKKNEVQILYTQIDRDKNNVPHFKSYSYNLNDLHYFFPASTVKLPTVIFALEKINELHVPDLSAKSTMLTGTAFAKQTAVEKDSSSGNGLPSVEHYIKKILLVSDNDAYNRLYEFISRAEINQKLKKYGLTTSRILNRYAVKDTEITSRHTNPVTFYDWDSLVYYQHGKFDPLDYPLALSNTSMGKAYLDSSDRFVAKPFNMANKNAFSITDQQVVMKKLLFPEVFPENERFNLTRQDYNLIYTYMSKYPAESDFPKYDPKEFWDVYAKFLLYGADKEALPKSNIRIFNKYGDSYGFIIDNAFIVDFENKIEFMLTAVVQSNEDGVYNDDKYEYKEVCYPFMKNLGEAVYEYELQRKKEYLPDLSKFIMKY
ncbi:serine hydrolase [Dyadobacter fanqingshengii]|uniref:Class A beta-lactamase-related serine hydrolase n=1 Tax=Dyadobacter fanqingshengii TaxID=2906443 RepID=A0A9X1T9Q8_9BACT|nr:serine hydrolase [Dyadobacter fanqingshengii]MCF0040911.1 class A beta-lactamase-related serine hydrolase [Dyadobacter fanqingshengii]USJ37357.1 class A beta-lactamase-related serine hydrolase [Dyadobacter fanqingshengii]